MGLSMEKVFVPLIFQGTPYKNGIEAAKAKDEERQKRLEEGIRNANR